MKREDLKALGLEESVIDTIMADNGKDIEKHKKDNEALQVKLTRVETQLTDATKKFASFEGLDIEAIKKEAADWKVAAKKAEDDGKATVEKLQFSHALDGALTGAKSKNSKAVKALLEMEGLKMNNGEIVGLNEQLTKIKTESPYLFDDVEAEMGKPYFAGKSGGTAGGKGATEDAAMRSAMGLPPLETK